MKKILLITLCWIPMILWATPRQSCVDILNLKQYWGTLSSRTVYELENAPIVTFIDPIPDGVIVYVQDISGGLMLFLPREIPNFLNKGDQLSGLRGLLALRNGSLILIPNTEPVIESSDNPVYPQQIDVSTLMLNPGVYESALVELTNITLNGGGTLFEAGKNYIIYQQKSTTALYTGFPLANYIDTPIPDAPVSITGLVNYNRLTGSVTITPRSLSDISYQHGNDPKGSWLADDIFSADGFLQIRSLTRQQISVYTLLGQLIIQEWVEPGFSEIQLPANGIYLVKLGKLTKRLAFP